MSERAASEGQWSRDALAEAVGVPLADFTLPIAGRCWHIRAARDRASLMQAAERFFALPLGLLLWEAAQALAAELAEDKARVAGGNVLELGAGVGLPGIVARAAGAAAVRQTDHISEALTLCRANAAANGVDGIELALANWDAWTDGRSYDLIIGSDVVYERSAHAALAAIIERNLVAGGRVLLADQGRPDTPRFVAGLAAVGWRSAQRRRSVPALRPGEGQTVGIDIIELWR